MISYIYEDTPWRLDLVQETTDWLDTVVRHHNYEIVEINYIFGTDEYILYLNKKYLDHDYYTDILTFNYSQFERKLVSDIYISVDRVRENAKEFEVPFIDELHRVMVHGILHLIGFDDVTDEKEEEMRRQEDFSLNLRMF